MNLLNLLLLDVQICNDGAVNTEMMTLCGFADKIPVLNYCHDGWYVPAIEEMNDVFIAYNGGPASAPGLKPDAITDTEKSAREAWDKLFTVVVAM